MHCIHIHMQIPEYEYHTKLPQWSYQIQIWYDHCAHTLEFAVYMIGIIIYFISELQSSYRAL